MSRSADPLHAKPSHRARLEARSPHPAGAPGRPAEPTVCPDCHAVCEEGRWRRREPLPGATPHLCPACVALRRRRPEGTVTLSGPFFRAHADEIMGLVRRVSEQAAASRPLQQLMEIDEDDAGAVISTTSAHLARAIGRAVNDAWKGELDLDAHAEGAPRVRWHR